MFDLKALLSAERQANSKLTDVRLELDGVNKRYERAAAVTALIERLRTCHPAPSFGPGDYYDCMFVKNFESVPPDNRQDYPGYRLQITSVIGVIVPDLIVRNMAHGRGFEEPAPEVDSKYSPDPVVNAMIHHVLKSRQDGVVTVGSVEHIAQSNCNCGRLCPLILSAMEHEDDCSVYIDRLCIDCVRTDKIAAGRPFVFPGRKRDRF
jgi:hypothetical protein